MPEYGEIRVDYITYTTGTSPSEGQGTVTVSGLINNPTFSGNVIVGNDLTVSGTLNANGMTVTGTVIISGTMSGESMTLSTGIFGSGSASAPSITFIDDLDTGIYAPAENELAISTSGTGRVFINESGKVGIGTNNPPDTFNVVSSSTNTEETVAAFGNQTINDGLRIITNGNLDWGFNAKNSRNLVFETNQTERFRVDTNGKVLIGRSSAGTVGGISPLFQVADNSVNAGFSFSRFTTNSNGPAIILGKARSSTIDTFTAVQNNNELGKILFAGADGTDLNSLGGQIIFTVNGAVTSNSIPTRFQLGLTKSGNTSPTNRLRLEADGECKYLVDSGSAFEIRRGGTSAAQVAFALYNDSNGFNNGTLVFAVNGDGSCEINNKCEVIGGGGATDDVLSVFDGSTLKFTVKGDGDCENANNRYTGFSDVKLKENIVDASSQWDDIKAIRVRNYNFKSETGYSTHTQIGVIAQELETISPGLIGETKDRDDEGKDLGTVTKSVSYSVMYMKAVKALQEAMERIETLEQRLSDAGL